MSRHYEIVTIVGVGLLGGSLGLALKARGLAGTVRGVGRRQSSLDAARAVGAVDETYLDLPQAVAGAQLVVICTPAALVAATLDEILPACSPEAVVTDVASTKADICAHADRTWPKPLRFVGSHPMAGSEKFGPEHAEAGLYQGSVTIVTPYAHTAPDALEAVYDLWQSVGSCVVELPPHQHDALAARTSHLPHVLAACISELVGQSGAEARQVVGNGFRDMTRISAGRPEVWRDICLTNRPALLNAVDALLTRMTEVRAMIERGDAAALEAFFEAGRRARHEVLGE